MAVGAFIPSPSEHLVGAELVPFPLAPHLLYKEINQRNITHL